MEGPRTLLYRTFLLVTIPIALLLAASLGATALYGLALACLGLVAAAWVMARRRLRGLEARHELVPNAFEDDAAVVDLVLENRSGRAAQLVEMSDRFGPGIADRQLLLEPGPLGAERRRRLSYQGFCSRRWGLYDVGPIALGASDPMGLFHAERTVGEIETFAVFPRVYEVAGLEKLGARPSLTPQETSAGRPGQGATYLGVRDYRPGDDLRRIHWPATARRGTPVLKEVEVDRVPYFTLILDLDRSHRAGTGKKSTLEYVVRAAASLLWSAIRRGDVVQIFGESSRTLFVPPGRGDLHFAHALYELIRVQQDGTTPLLEVVERYRPHLPEGSTAALLSGTIALEHARLAETVEALRAGGVRPLVLCVNNFTFLPVDKWPLPRAEAVERRRELEFFLRSRGVPGAIVGAGEELEQEFARHDLFGVGP